MSIWLLLFIILLIVELATVNLVTIWFAIGCIASYITSFFIDSWIIQLVIFIFISTVTLLLTKPIIKKVKKGIIENKDIIIDKIGIVTEDIDDLGNGRVIIDGITWKAVSNKVIEKNSKIVVKDIDGIKLLVEKRRD